MLRAVASRAWPLAPMERAASALATLKNRCLPCAPARRQARFADVGEAARRQRLASARTPACAPSVSARSVMTAAMNSSPAGGDRLFIIDGSELLQKAHGFDSSGKFQYGASRDRPPGRLMSRNGVDSQVQFGFANTMLILLRELPTHIVVVFDPRSSQTAGGDPTYSVRGWLSNQVHQVPLFTAPEGAPRAATWRHAFYPGYKQKRRDIPFPQEITDAQPWCAQWRCHNRNLIPIAARPGGRVWEFLGALGVSAVQYPGVEGDDIIASIALAAAEQPGVEVTIVSGDKDFNQLLSPQIRIRKTRKENQDFSLEAFAAEFPGFAPQNFVDYLALVGDSSDDIPGVSKVGEKTALALLKEFKSLDGVLAASENLGSVDPIVAKATRLHLLAGTPAYTREQIVQSARLSWTLAELCVRNAANQIHLHMAAKQLADYPPLSFISLRSEPKEGHYSDFVLARPRASELRALFRELDFADEKYHEFARLWSGAGSDMVGGRR